MALLLALARNIPQAHTALTSGRWERSKFSGVELYEKTLGIVGFGRIGQLVAHRARGFGMRVLAFDPFVSAERYRELGVEKAETSDDLFAQADFITLHLPKTPDTEGWLNARAFANLHVPADYCIGADEGSLANAGARIDNRGRVNEWFEGRFRVKQNQCPAKSKVRIFRTQDRDIVPVQDCIVAKIDR